MPPVIGHTVTLRGRSATLVWGYRTAAMLGDWTIRKAADAWTLTGDVVQGDPFQLRQKPLLFIAPRDGGFWTWPIRTLTTEEPRKIRATLGPPEQG